VSKLSLHQLPKSAEFLECFVPDPGHLLVSIDFSALEPKVLAYFSRDRNLLALYGPNASPHQDIYLYNAVQMGDLGKRILACGYNPNNPTPEAVARAKKECKDDRAVSKLISLACFAEGTLVRVKGRGYVRIETVTAKDEVWDGFHWVTTTGAVDQGLRETFYLDVGVVVTADHKFLGENGEWYPAQHFWKVSSRTDSAQPQRPNKPSASWTEVWQMVGFVGRSAVQQWISFCVCSLRTFSRRCLEVLR
jgi:hypothetical protein